MGPWQACWYHDGVCPWGRVKGGIAEWWRWACAERVWNPTPADSLHLRLVIRPSPELYWSATGAPPTKSGAVTVDHEILVVGQLLIINGDGAFDGQVSGVAPDQDLPGANRGLFACPNPFNPTTEIRWSIAEGAAARLVIHDVAGEVVARYDLAAGSTRGQVSWDGRDEAGRHLPSGIYLAVLQSSDGRPVASTKLTLLK